MWFITLSNRMAHLYTNLYTHESPEVRTRKEEMFTISWRKSTNDLQVDRNVTR